MDLEQARRLAHFDQRRVAFSGTMNCRDLGGLPIAGGGTTCRGRVFRSGRLSNLEADDVTRFDTLGIRQVCDLRLPFERERFPNDSVVATPPPQFHFGYLPAHAMDTFEAINAGTIDAEGVRSSMCGQYRDMATGHPDIHRQLFRRLLAPAAAPSLIHCSAGKDRTGVAVALLLRAAGVAREVVIADYLLTNVATPKLGVIRADAAPDLLAQVGLAHAEYLTAALDAVEQAYDDYAAFFVDGVGMRETEATALCALLRE